MPSRRIQIKAKPSPRPSRKASRCHLGRLHEYFNERRKKSVSCVSKNGVFEFWSLHQMIIIKSGRQETALKRWRWRQQQRPPPRYGPFRLYYIGIWHRRGTPVAGEALSPLSGVWSHNKDQVTAEYVSFVNR